MIAFKAAYEIRLHVLNESLNEETMNCRFKQQCNSFLKHKSISFTSNNVDCDNVMTQTVKMSLIL